MHMASIFSVPPNTNQNPKVSYKIHKSPKVKRWSMSEDLSSQSPDNRAKCTWT